MTWHVAGTHIELCSCAPGWPGSIYIQAINSRVLCLPHCITGTWEGMDHEFNERKRFHKDARMPHIAEFIAISNLWPAI